MRLARSRLFEIMPKIAERDDPHLCVHITLENKIRTETERQNKRNDIGEDHSYRHLEGKIFKMILKNYKHTKTIFVIVIKLCFLEKL